VIDKTKKLYKVGKRQRSEADIPHSFISKIVSSNSEEEFDKALIEWLDSSEVIDIEYIVNSTKSQLREIENGLTYLPTYELIDNSLYDNVILTIKLLNYKLDEMLEKAIRDNVEKETNKQK
jgi:hypothetical protein